MEILSAKNKSLEKSQKKIDLSCNTEVNNKKNCIISLRINTLLYDTLHNYLSAMHNVSDYTFSSISDVLRYILVQIEENGFSTDQIIHDKETEYTEIIVRVTQKQKQFWKSLPNRNRRKIMEKAILAFTKTNYNNTIPYIALHNILIIRRLKKSDWESNISHNQFFKNARLC